MIQPVILVTAYEREYASRRGREIGIDAVLHKPVSPSMLHDAVVNVLVPGTPMMRPRTLEVQVQFAPGKRVLLVEDNEINREVARELLTLAGLEVIEAHTGYQALDRLAEGHFDAVLMDVQMPEVDGLQATRDIRSHPAPARVPIIALTAHAMESERQRCLDAGMDDHLAKPIDPVILARTLARWIRPGMGTTSADEGADAAAPPLRDLPPQLPALAGFDMPEALARLGGKMDLLRKLMVRLREGFADAPKRIRALLAAGSHEEAERLAHTLKAVAGTMGANDVAARAAELEIQLRSGDHRSAGPAIDALQTALAVALASIASLEGGGDAAAALAPGTAVDPAAYVDALRELDALLRVRSLRARKCFAQLRPVLDQHEAGAGERIAEAMARLDFSAARTILGEVLPHFGVTVEGPVA